MTGIWSAEHFRDVYHTSSGQKTEEWQRWKYLLFLMPRFSRFEHYLQINTEEIIGLLGCRNTLENCGRRWWVIEVSPFRLKQELFAQMKLSVSYSSRLQVQSLRLCPNDRLVIDCSLFFILIKLILFPEEVSGVSRCPWCSFPSMALTRLWRHFSNFACWAYVLKSIISFPEKHFSSCNQCLFL